MSIAREYYLYHVGRESDINEHLPVLRAYASKCNHVTELGVRWIVSTWAFLAAAPEKLVSLDIKRPEDFGADLRVVERAARELEVDFEFRLANSLEVDLEPTDLLFIDTLHTYDQLSRELSKHSKAANKWIILHDTTTFEAQDEGARGGPGLWPAVEEFLSLHPEWRLFERRTNNNGLTVLIRE